MITIKKARIYHGVQVREVLCGPELQEDGVSYDLRRWPEQTDWILVRRTAAEHIGDFPQYDYLARGPLREMKNQLPQLIRQAQKKASRMKAIRRKKETIHPSM